VQHFVNPTAIERLAEEALTGPRARLVLAGLISAALAVSAGPALAAIWLGLSLLAHEGRLALSNLARTLPPADRASAELALAAAMSALGAAAPLLAWSAGGELGPPLATAMLCVLLAHAAQSSGRGRRATLAACAPYAAAALLFLLHGAAMASFSTALLSVACAGYVFAVALNQSHRLRHARQLDREWVRQSNMAAPDPNAAVWEIDFAEQRLAGGDRLAALLGLLHTIAPESERPVLRGLFAPGPSRNVTVEHQCIAANGTLVRVRHNGFLRTAPSGAPLRFTCVTRLASADEALLKALLSEAERVLDEQTATLAQLSRSGSGRGQRAPGKPA
jgi:hypothetical protein